MRRLQPAALVAAALIALLAPRGLFAQADADRLKTAKSLSFDKKYAEARTLWQQIQKAGGADAELAALWIARCSDGLQENERALAEYSEYLARRPQDEALAEEARTSRVRLAIKLYESGKRQHLAVLKEALADSNKTVRYFAALQLASLGPEVGQPAVPVLKQIIAEGKDEDLVERAKLRLLKVDPDALVEPPARATTPRPRPSPNAQPAPGPARAAAWLRVRIFEEGVKEPKVSINLPIALADLVFKSLPEDAKRDLRRNGYDADNFWEQLKKLGPTDIIEIVGERERIKIWIE
jgi:hypothetical protein